MGALAGAMVLVKNNQNNQGRASGTGANSMLLPSQINTKVGEEFGVNVWLNTGGEKNSFYRGQIKLKYDRKMLSRVKTEDRGRYRLKDRREKDDRGEDNEVMDVEQVGETGSGAINVGRVFFRAKKAGTAEIVLEKTWFETGKEHAKIDLTTNEKTVVTITGGNGEVAIMTPIAPTNNLRPTEVRVVATGIPTVLPTAVPTLVPTTPAVSPTTAGGQFGGQADGILKFKVAYDGVAPGAKCTSNWLNTVTVLDGGKSYQFKGVKFTEVTATGSLATYQGEVRLTGVASKNNLAVFIKGPRQIQVKFGMNNQTSIYNKAGGEIVVTTDGATTPVYDFSGYPMGAGDVVGKDLTQDGSVDGRDFNYVKGEVAKRTEGDNLLADLNGNCKLESFDLSLLMGSLRDKQEIMY